MEIDPLGYTKREVANLAVDAKNMLTQALAIGSLVIDLTRAYAPHLAKVAATALQEAAKNEKPVVVTPTEEDSELTYAAS